MSQVVDAIKDLVADCNFDCNDSGIALQAMDNSHVALVSMILKTDSFDNFRCDRNIALGVNLTSLTKVLRAAQNEDVLTIKADDAPDVLNLHFESSSKDRFSEYDLKLMDIDQEHLGIPDTDYASIISMPSAEFKRICTDLQAVSESGTSWSFPRSSSYRRLANLHWRAVTIEASKDGIKFSCTGDIGNGSVTLRSHTNVEKEEESVQIELNEPVALTFSLKYMVNFCKATSLSSTVRLCLSNEVPLLVEYQITGDVGSHLRFYLAPKVCHGARPPSAGSSHAHSLLTVSFRLAMANKGGIRLAFTWRYSGLFESLRWILCMSPNTWHWHVLGSMRPGNNLVSSFLRSNWMA